MFIFIWYTWVCFPAVCVWRHVRLASTSLIQRWMIIVIVDIFVIHFAPLCMTESGSAKRGVVKWRKRPATAQSNIVTSHKLASSKELQCLASLLVQTSNVEVAIFRQFLCCWYRHNVDGLWHWAVLQKGPATPSWQQLEVFPMWPSTWYDVTLTAPSSSSSSALQPCVGFGLLKQMSPANSVLDIRPPFSTTQFPYFFLYPVNPSWFQSVTSSLTSRVWQAIMSDLQYCISTCSSV